MSRMMNDPSGERMYHLYGRRQFKSWEDPTSTQLAMPSGTEWETSDYTRLTSTPVTHREALTIKSKFQPERQARILFVEIQKSGEVKQ